MPNSLRGDVITRPHNLPADPALRVPKPLVDRPLLDPGGHLQIDSVRWRLQICGLVDAERVFDWEQLNALPRATVACDIRCVTRAAGLVHTFQGPLVGTVMSEFKILPQATNVLIHSHDRLRGVYWTTHLSLEEFLSENCLFATHDNGQPLPPKHGGPCRVVVPGVYSWKSAKWVSAVQILAEGRHGLWRKPEYRSCVSQEPERC